MALRRTLIAACAITLVAGGLAVVRTASAETRLSSGSRVETLPIPQRPRDVAPEFDPHTVLVRFKKGASAAAKAKALSSRRATKAGLLGGSGFVKVRSTGKATALLSGLRKDPAVAEASLDFRRRASVAPPDDPMFESGQRYLSTIRLRETWDLVRDASSQVIAVVDTGVDTGHVELAGRTVAGFNAIDPGASPADDHGHGTMVAGIAAAQTNNGRGVAGATWTGRVMPVKVLNKNGRGYDSDIITGVRWAADHGAKVINLSLGGPGGSPALREAMAYAAGKGAVVIAAAGNTGGDIPEYPAAFPEVLAVGATDHDGQITSFSTYGDWVDVAAPGFNIVGPYPGRDSIAGSGTSFSAPLVSAVTALMRTRFPALSPAQVMRRLRDTARDAGPRGIDPYYGAGLLDAFHAVGGNYGGDLPARMPGADEPNDVPARATVLTGSATGAIGGEGDVDWYRYENAGQAAVKITTTPPGFIKEAPRNIDPIVAVYDAKLRLLGEYDYAVAGDAETIPVVLGPGTHYVSVRNRDGGFDTRTYGLTVAPAPPPILDPAVRLPLAEPGSAVVSDTAVGDVTGDGKGDIVSVLMDVTTPAFTTTLIVIAQRADGTMAAPVRHPMASSVRVFPRIALADTSGDGKLDVLLSTDGGVEIRPQTADGGLGAGTLVPNSADARDMAARDIDGDGDIDLVVSQNFGVTLLTQAPEDTFSSHHLGSAVDGEIRIGDVSGDGKADIVTSNGGVLRRFHQAAAGWSQVDLPITDGKISGLEVADVTGDGKADVAVTTGSEGSEPGQVMVLPQTTDGGLGTAVVRPVADFPDPVVAADVDADGRTDLVVRHTGGTLTLLRQQADGAPGTAETYVSPPMVLPGELDELAVGDINSDDRPDVVSGEWSGLLLQRSTNGVSTAGERGWVHSVSTPDFANGVSTGVVPTVTFERALDPASVTDATIRLLNGRTGAPVNAMVRYDSATKTVVIRPASALDDNGAYRVVVGAVKDDTGATNTRPWSSTFQVADVAPASVAKLTVAGGYAAATLTWVLPAIADLDQVIVRMAPDTTTPPASPTAGLPVYAGVGTTATVRGLTASRYAFAVWARDRAGALSPAATVRVTNVSATSTVTPAVITAGGTTKVSARFVRRDTNGGLAGVPAYLTARRRGTTAWVVLAKPTTNSTGTVTFAHKASWGYQYIWQFRGSPAYLGVQAPTQAVGVRPAIAMKLSVTKVKRGGSVTISGQVSPAHPKHRVYLQKLVKGQWVVVASQLLKANSTYSFKVKLTARGTFKYRIRKPADVDNLENITASRTVKVT